MPESTSRMAPAMHILFTCLRASTRDRRVGRPVRCDAMRCGAAEGRWRGRTEVVERVEDDVEGLEPGEVELRVFDVGVDGGDVHGGVERGGGAGGNLCGSSTHGG